MRSRKLLLPAAAVAVGGLVAAGAALSTAAQAATAPVGLHVSGTQLLERNGTPFVERGVSHAHTWYTSQTATAIPAIRAAGANALRVVLSDGHRWTKNDATDVANVISLCKANHLICMLEDHDTTGYGEEGAASSLDMAADYWISLASVLKGQEDYIQINIGNEPFGNNDTANASWASSTIAAIKKLRAAGFHHNLVVDGPAWGQDWKNIMRDSAASIEAADPDANTLFSIHMYDVYSSASTITSYLDAFKAAGLPLIIGELGWRATSSNVDTDTAMAEAVKRGIGYLGWSWSGNTDPILDMTTSFDPTRLTAWGTRIFQGVNGIVATARTATVYGGTTNPPTTPPPTTPPPTTPPVTPTPTPTPTPTVTTPPATGACTATFKVVGSWPGGFQATVTVTAGSKPISGWKTSFTLPSGVGVQNGWSGTFSSSGQAVTVTNAAWNGSLGAGAGTDYGFIGTGTAPTGTTTVACSAS